MLMVTIIQIGSNLHHTALHIVSSSSRVARQRGCRGSRRASSGDDSTDDVARSHGVAVQRARCWRIHLVVRHRVAVLVILGNGRHADLSKRRERKLRRRLDDARHGHARDGSRRERSRRSEAKDSEEVAEHFIVCKQARAQMKRSSSRRSTKPSEGVCARRLWDRRQPWRRPPDRS